MGAALGRFGAAVKYKYQTLHCKHRARREPSSSSSGIPAWAQDFQGIGRMWGVVRRRQDCAELFVGACLGKAWKLQKVKGRGINAFYLSLLSPFGPELLSSCPAVITVAVPQAMAKIWGKTPAAAQDKWQ